MTSVRDFHTKFAKRNKKPRCFSFKNHVFALCSAPQLRTRIYKKKFAIILDGLQSLSLLFCCRQNSVDFRFSIFVHYCDILTLFSFSFCALHLVIIHNFEIYLFASHKYMTSLFPRAFYLYLSG